MLLCRSRPNENKPGRKEEGIVSRCTASPCRCRARDAAHVGIDSGPLLYNGGRTGSSLYTPREQMYRRRRQEGDCQRHFGFSLPIVDRNISPLCYGGQCVEMGKETGVKNGWALRKYISKRSPRSITSESLFFLLSDSFFLVHVRRTKSRRKRVPLGQDGSI